MSARNVADSSPWQIAKLGDVCEKITDGTHHSPCNGQTGDFKYVTAKNIRPSGLDLNDITYVDAATHREIYSRCDVRKDDILYVKDGATTGRVALNTLEEEFSLLSSVGVLRPNRQCVLPKYLLYALQAPTVKDRMLADVAGVAITRLTLKKLKAAEIPLAPLDQQGYIVAELEQQFSRLDEAVANLKRVKANLKRYKAAVLDAAMNGSIGAARGAGPDELPTGWTWTTVGALAKVGTGATPARSNDAFYRGGTIPWITSSAVNEPFVDAADQFVTAEALRMTNLTLYPPGALLVAMYGEGKTRGKCSELRIAATTNQALAVLQADSAVRPWLKLFIEHNYDNTRRIASGGVQPNLNLGLIRAIRLPLPPGEEQQRIVAEVDRRLSIVREVEAEVDANLIRAQALRQAVLARAFGGGLSGKRASSPASCAA